MTLRGIFTLADNAILSNHQVFTYEAGDLTRAWKVKAFYIWPADIRGAIGSADGQYMMAANIATDVTPGSAFTPISDCTDIRQIGWMQRGYNLRDDANDFINAHTGLVTDSQGLIDPDHVINNELFINAYTTSSSSVAFSRKWNYMVVLDAIKISPTQAILQLIKGKAQDISN